MHLRVNYLDVVYQEVDAAAHRLVVAKRFDEARCALRHRDQAHSHDEERRPHREENHAKAD